MDKREAEEEKLVDEFEEVLTVGLQDHVKGYKHPQSIEENVA